MRMPPLGFAIHHLHHHPSVTVSLRPPASLATTANTHPSPRNWPFVKIATDATGALAKIALHCKDTQDQLKKLLGDGAERCETFAKGLDAVGAEGDESRADLDAKLNDLRSECTLAHGCTRHTPLAYYHSPDQ